MASRKQFLRQVVVFEHPISLTTDDDGGRVLKNQTLSNPGIAKTFQFQGT
jgi:hypothetical protein